MRAEDPLYFIVANYTSLEAQLVDCMEYIPYIQRNMDTVSPKFIPILIESCSLIDSIFRHMSDGKKHYNLKEYSSMHEERLELEEASSLLLVSPMRILQPFKSWTKTPPEWWQAYNKVKHDRINNYHVATYNYTVLALVGLHQVIARSWMFIENLIKAGWFNMEDEEGFMDLISSRCSCSGPPDLPVETKLIVSPIRDTFIVTMDEDDTVVSERWRFSPRVTNFIWDHEWG